MAACSSSWFDAFCRAQQELVERQKHEEAEAKEKQSKFSEDVRAQIREKERQRISERKKYFEEGVKLDEEARQRQLKLEEVKRRKLEELRYERLFYPQYITAVVRQFSCSDVAVAAWRSHHHHHHRLFSDSRSIEITVKQHRGQTGNIQRYTQTDISNTASERDKDRNKNIENLVVLASLVSINEVNIR